MKILIIEDDLGLIELLSTALARHHYSIEVAYDGPPGLALANAFSYDLILLDLGLPTIDGISLCKQMREAGVTIPILLMTVEEAQSAKVQALDAGADDYLVKPIDMAELLARIRALLRRGDVQQTPFLTWGPICLDPATCQVTCADNVLHLTAKEYELLELFLRHPHQIFSPERLIAQLWSLGLTPTHSAVRARIKSLRDKLQAMGVAPIETIHSMGYQLATDPGSVVETQATTEFGVVSGLTPAFSPIWERHRKDYFESVAMLEQAIVGLKTQSYTREMQQRAQQVAHTLKGSLGSFGLSLAAQLAGEIEALLPTVSPVNQTDLTKLVSRVFQLKLALERVEPPATIAVQILIVHSDPLICAQLISEAALWGMSAEAVTTLAEAQTIITQLRPNLVLLDLVSLDQLNQTVEMLAQIGPPVVPMIALTGQLDLSTRVKASNLGGVQLLQASLSAAQIMTAVRQTLQTLQKLHRYPIKLLVIDDDRAMLACLRDWLEPLGFELTLLNTPGDFWSALERTVPDVVILDVKMPDFSGIELCQAIRRDRTWQKLPIIFLSAHRDADTVQKVFEAGADDLLHKPTHKTEVVTRLYNRLQRSQWSPVSDGAPLAMS